MFSASLQKLQQEATVLTEAKQRNLQQLKNLTGQQQMLDSQLHQARQDVEGSTRKLSHLQRENSTLQVGQQAVASFVNVLPLGYKHHNCIELRCMFTCHRQSLG